MATQAIERGPTARRAAANVRSLRERKKLTRAALAERMGLLGRHISGNGLLKMEDGTRRIDADDLMALALALQTTPNRLLLAGPPDQGEAVELAPNMTVSWQEAWQWASGDGLPFGHWPDGEPHEFPGLDSSAEDEDDEEWTDADEAGWRAYRADWDEQEAEFLKDARPHDPHGQLDGMQLAEAYQSGAVAELAAAVAKLHEHGFDIGSLPVLIKIASAVHTPPASADRPPP